MHPIARSDDLLVSRLEDEVVVFDQRSERYHHLNPLAAFVWERCDGETDVDSLTEKASESFGLESTRPMVDEALVELTEAGLLEAGTEEMQVEESVGKGVSRRSALRKMAATGAAVAALPLVTTMAAPDPAAARSPTSGDGDYDWDEDEWDHDDDGELDDGERDDWEEFWRRWKDWWRDFWS